MMRESLLTEVQILITEEGVTSSRTTFAPGLPYLLAVTNEADRAHGLGLVFTGTTDTPCISNKVMLVNGPCLHPGETQEVSLSFHPSLLHRDLELACGLPGHSETGLPIRIADHRVS